MTSGHAWIMIIVAGVFEIIWALAMKQSEGFSRFWPSVLCVGMMLASFGLLLSALRWLEVGTAYAVWTGIGAAGTALFGILLFKEPATASRLLFLSLILIGIVGLKSSSH